MKLDIGKYEVGGIKNTREKTGYFGKIVDKNIFLLCLLKVY